MVGKLGLALVDRALLSKALIQLSGNGWDYTPCLLIVWPEVTQPWGEGLMVTSKSTHAKGDLPRMLLPMPHPCGEPLPIHTFTGDPPTLAGNFGSVVCGVTAPFLWVLVNAKFCWCCPRLESLFLPVLWKSYCQTVLLSRSDSLGIPSPFVRSPGWEGWCGVQNFYNSGRTSVVLLFSSLWVTDTGFDFILIVPLLLSHWGFFVFGPKASFFGEFQYSPFDGCSAVAMLVLWQEKMSACTSSPPSWTGSQQVLF